MKRLLLAACVLCGVAVSSSAARVRQNFDRDWLFLLADTANMSMAGYDDAAWRRLDLPHDWAIEGDFSAAAKSGASGGALPGGTGWYRKHFTLNDPDARTSRYFIEFDGVYMNSTVYVNGKEVGHRPYGYSSFEYDITPYVNLQGSNVVAVRVDNSDQPNSRWYSGCGIYRHVWFTKTADVHIKHWGMQVVPVVGEAKKRATVGVAVELANHRGRPVKASVRQQLLDAAGNVVATRTARAVTVGREADVTLSLPVRSPRLWDVADPYIYKVKAEVWVDGVLADSCTAVTGFRAFRFDAQTGFWLNGRNMKINGVCEHHDLGCLGAAFTDDAMHRKLVKLKAMGVNAIRCSHNPPAPELLNMCDTMGLIVMDESFDMWRRRKTKNDYARFFDQWAERDLTDMVKRDRNHPSILMWSIGNEVLEQWSAADADTLTAEQANLILNAGRDASALAKDGEVSINALLTRQLAAIVRRHDATRPVTAGCNEPSPDNHLFRSGALDIIGFNYHHQWIKDVPEKFPGRPFILTESVSALQTTGNYIMPSDSIISAPKEWWLPYTDPSFMCSAYDNMHASWSSTHEETWDVVKHTPYVGGQFIWTGFDYIGEPTPYGFPARSSYFGIIDLSGCPKDVYYMYQSEWTDKPVLHLFPHWNWLQGQVIDMWCYYNHADEVELFVNGKSKGVRRKADSHQYHVMWRVVFEPGEVKVVARKGGAQIAEQAIRTAGQPYRLRLATDYKGKNTTFVAVEVVDKDGNRCPWAENQVFFETEDAEIIGVDNGCQTSMERFKDNKRKAFFGRCMVVLKGKGRLTAKAIGLKDCSILTD